MLTIVSGIGRCGSSLMMAMLKAGGIEPSSEADPLDGYEDDRFEGDAKGGELIAEDGRAVKMLWLNAAILPRGLDCRVILMLRDFEQQAASHRKLMAESLKHRIGSAVDPVRKATQRTLTSIVQTGTPVLAVRFEELLADPRSVAQAVSVFLERPDIDIEAMVREVAPRGPECFDGIHPKDTPGHRIAETGGVRV